MCHWAIPSSAGGAAGDCSPPAASWVRAAASSSGRRTSPGSLLPAGPKQPRRRLRSPVVAPAPALTLLPPWIRRAPTQVPCPEAHLSRGRLCRLHCAASPFPADRAPPRAQPSLRLALPVPLAPPACPHPHLPPGSGASAHRTLVGTQLPWPSPKGWGVPPPLRGARKSPPALSRHTRARLGLTKRGRRRQRGDAARMLQPRGSRGAARADWAQRRPCARSATRSPAMGSTECTGQAWRCPRLRCPQPLPRGARICPAVLPLPGGQEVLPRRTGILPAAMSCHLRFC